MSTLSDYTPVILVIVFMLLAAGSVVEQVLDSCRPPSPEWGCCGCGAAECDVVVAPDDRGRGEGYCWRCIDTWPADAPSPSELGFTVFPGHERTAR
jgi:hypothetical protein